MVQVVLFCPTCEQAQTHRIAPGEDEALWPKATCGLCGTTQTVKRNKRRMCGCVPGNDHKVCPICAGTMHRNNEPGLLHRWACSSCAYDEVI